MYKHSHKRISGKGGLDKLGHRDVEKEYEGYECAVEGTIPSWLHGTIYKQSGGAFSDEYDFLDGLAQIVSFSVEDGKVKFTNKYMRTKDYERFVNKDERAWGSTAAAVQRESMTTKIAGKVKAAVGLGSYVIHPSLTKYHGANPNVNVWVSDNGRKLGAATEATGLLCAFDPKTLETLPSVKTMKPRGRISMIVTNPAHYVYDYDGSNGGYHIALEMKINVFGIQPTFTFNYVVFHGDEAPYKPVHTSKLASFKYMDRANQPAEKRAAYMHSVACTENYFVVMLTSERMQYEKLVGGDFSEGFFGVFEHTDAPVEFMVYKIDHETNGLELTGSYKSEFNGMVWHGSNSYETGEGKIVIDITSAGSMRMEHTSDFSRFEIDLAAGTVVHNVIRTTSSLAKELEFPNANPNYLKKPYRYSYMTSNLFEPTSSVFKVDVEGGLEDDKRLFDDENTMPSEAVFVPAPNAESEDDGVVLVITMDSAKEISHLQIIDGKSFKVVATAAAPMVVNAGLHSVYVPSGGFKSSIKL